MRVLLRVDRRVSDWISETSRRLAHEDSGCSVPVDRRKLWLIFARAVRAHVNDTRTTNVFLQLSFSEYPCLTRGGGLPEKTSEAWTDTLFATLTDGGMRVGGALLFLFAAWVLSAWIVRLSVRAMAKAKVDITLSKFLANVIRWGLLILALVACLSIFGVQTASFAAVIGSAGLAIGLALQGSLSNLAAGVMLMLFRRFTVGDVISVGGQLGKVDEVELFATRLDTPDNRRIIISNSQVFNAVVENITHNAERRVDIDVGVEYSADIDRTREVLLAAALAVPGRVATREPDAFLKGLGASAVEWQVRVWAPRENFAVVRQATVRAVKMALDEAQIGIPFPQMVVHPPKPSTVRLNITASGAETFSS
jgi:small conductance mechanosensitive channel